MCAPGFTVELLLDEVARTVTYEPAATVPPSILQVPPGLAVHVPRLVVVPPTELVVTKLK